MITTFFKIGIWLFLFLFFILSASAQKNYLKAVIKDTVAKKNLQYSIVSLIDQADSVLYIAVRSNELGAFQINKIPPGKYILMVSYPQMADYLQQVTITDTSKIDFGKINMVSTAVLLEEVVVRSGLPIRMRGDTLEYTADSFAIKPGSNVEELLKRLPGVYIDRNGKITAQGKEIKKILVDGDEFFNDDPGLVAQFLKADAIDKVQVFDGKSDAATFTGIDDGKRIKTINLKLKANKKNGSFGKLAAGSNGDKYYNHEAMGSLFKGAKKISVFGIASKTGKEGVSSNELSKYVSQDYEMIDDGNNNIHNSDNEYESENYYGNGLPSVLNGGLHYSNKWKGGKQKLFSNYRVKETKAKGWSNSRTASLLPDSTSFYNESNNKESSSNFIQKVSTNFTAQLDSFSTIKISFNGNLSRSNINTSDNSSSKNEKNFFVNNSTWFTTAFTNSKKMGSNISYQHRFKKEGRTLALIAQQAFSEGNKDNYNYAKNNYFDPSSGIFTNADTLNQLQNNYQLNNSFATKILVTEMLSKLLTLSADYGWKTVGTKNKFKTFNSDNGKYTNLLDSLSNNYDFTVNTNIAGTTITMSRKKINITAGTQIYFTGFKQVNNDLKVERRRSFINLAPKASIQYNINPFSSFGLSYFGETFQPEIEQLQPLRRSSNPLYVQIGNPNLSPAFNHDVSINYRNYNFTKGNNLFAYASIRYVNNSIVSKTKLDVHGQSTQEYINLNGVPAMYGSVYYNWEYKKLHLRPGINISFNSSGSNSILNNIKVNNKNANVMAGFTLNYDLENKMALAYSGRISFDNSKSNYGNTGNRQNITHTHNLSGSFYLPKKFELSSDCNFNFQPRNSSFNSSFNFIMWNAYIQKKLLKNNKAFAKLSVNDILNNNTGFNRYIYGNDITEYDRLVIKRYFLFTIGFNFSKSVQ
jgi:hypothetical protein